MVAGEGNALPRENAPATRWGAGIADNRCIDPDPCIPDKRTDLLPKVGDL
jgi:hypothetical protein